MIVKIMTGDGHPDIDASKQHRLYDDVRDVGFYRGLEGESYIGICFRDGNREDRRIYGNVYVMNDRGHTFDSYCPPGDQRAEAPVGDEISAARSVPEMVNGPLEGNGGQNILA